MLLEMRYLQSLTQPFQFSISSKTPQPRDFPGGPVAKTVLPMQGVWVRSLVRDLDPTSCMLQQRSEILSATTNIWYSQINQ